MREFTVEHSKIKQTSEVLKEIMSKKQKSREQSEIRRQEHDQDDEDNESGIYERYTSIRYEEYNKDEKSEINKIITVRLF